MSVRGVQAPYDGFPAGQRIASQLFVLVPRTGSTVESGTYFSETPQEFFPKEDTKSRKGRTCLRSGPVSTVGGGVLSSTVGYSGTPAIAPTTAGVVQEFTGMYGEWAPDQSYPEKRSPH